MKIIDYLTRYKLSSRIRMRLICAAVAVILALLAGMISCAQGNDAAGAGSECSEIDSFLNTAVANGK